MYSSDSFHFLGYIFIAECTYCKCPLEKRVRGLNVMSGNLRSWEIVIAPENPKPKHKHQGQYCTCRETESIITQRFFLGNRGEFEYHLTSGVPLEKEVCVVYNTSVQIGRRNFRTGCGAYGT